MYPYAQVINKINYLKKKIKKVKITTAIACVLINPTLFFLLSTAKDIPSISIKVAFFFIPNLIILGAAKLDITGNRQSISKLQKGLENNKDIYKTHEEDEKLVESIKNSIENKNYLVNSIKGRVEVMFQINDSVVIYFKDLEGEEVRIVHSDTTISFYKDYHPVVHELKSLAIPLIQEFDNIKIQKQSQELRDETSLKILNLLSQDNDETHEKKEKNDTIILTNSKTN